MTIHLHESNRIAAETGAAPATPETVTQAVSATPLNAVDAGHGPDRPGTDRQTAAPQPTQGRTTGGQKTDAQSAGEQTTDGPETMNAKIFDHARFAPDQLRIMSLPAIARGGRWRLEALRSSEQPTLVWFIRSQGRITIAGRTRGYGPNTAVFLPPRTMYAFEVSPGAQGLVVQLPRHGTLWPEEPALLKVPTVQEQSELTGLFEALQREQAERRPGAARALTAYTTLLAVWLERQIGARGNGLGRAGRAEDLARRFTELAEAELGSGKTVAEIAATLGVTPTHLSRVCRRVAGRPASAILHERTIYEARRLLAETDMRVKDVAARLGYSSPAYFTRDFVQRTGKTPSQFRREARRG